MRQSGRMYESNSESEGAELFRPRKTVNEPPSPDLKHRTRQRAPSRDGTRGGKGDDMKHMSSEKENHGGQAADDRQRRELWERQSKNFSLRGGNAGEAQVPGGRKTRTNTLDAFSSADSESFLGHRLRIPSSNAGDSSRHNPTMIKQEIEETPPKRHSSRPLVRSSSRASPSQAATNSSAAKKLSNFKAAEKAGRTICVCGASAYYERERFALLKEKAKLKEDQQALREESKRVMENHRKVKEEIFECEKKRNELESCGRSLQRNREMQQEEAAVLEQSRRQLQKLKDQIEKDKDALQRTQQDLILKGEEFAARKAHLERLQQDLKNKKAELEERSIQIKKQAIKNESVESTLEMESHKLATLQSELALESEQIKQREATLRENEGRYEEKRRMLQSLESRLNHEVSMNEEKMKYLEEKEAELQRKTTELEQREAEVKKIEQDLERQKQELSVAKSEFEFQRQRELESIENEKKAAAVEIQLSKEDCAAFIELEKEWISQEKENLSKHKEAVQIELEAEKEHTQQMMNQMRKRNNEAIAEEKEEWRREQQRITESRNRQRLELESLREALSQKEYELVSMKENLTSEREQLEQEKAALESFKEIEMKKVQAEKTESLKLAQQIRKERQNCAQIEAQLKARESALDAREEALNARDKEMQQQWHNLSRIELQWDTRKKELEQRAKQLASLQKELAEQKDALVAREKRLTNSEAQAAWLKEIYAELKDKKEAIAAQEKRLEMERMAILEQRQSLMMQQQQAPQIRGTPSHTSSFRFQQRATPKRFPSALCRRYSTSGLPQIQTILPPHSRLASLGPVITVSSGDEGSNRAAHNHQSDTEPRQIQTPDAQLFQAQANPPSETAFDAHERRAASIADFEMPGGAADWSMFTAFDDVSGGDLSNRAPRMVEIAVSATEAGADTLLNHTKVYGDTSKESMMNLFSDKRSNVEPVLGTTEPDDDDVSLSSRDRHLLKHFGDQSNYTATSKAPAPATGGATETRYDHQRSQYTPMTHQLSPPMSSFRSKDSKDRESSRSRCSMVDNPQLSNRNSSQSSQAQSALMSHRKACQHQEARGGSDRSPAADLATSNEESLEVTFYTTAELRNGMMESGAQDHLGHVAGANWMVETTGDKEEVADEEEYERLKNALFAQDEANNTNRSHHLASTSSRGSSPLMCPIHSAQDQDVTPSHDGSAPPLADPSLSAPTTSPTYMCRQDLGLHLTNIDFDTSIGPSICSAALVDCTDEVRESIEHTIQMTYGSSHRSWQEEQDAYKSINRSLEVLGSGNQKIEAEVQKPMSSKSLTTSERTTTGAHENEGPSNSVWE